MQQKELYLTSVNNQADLNSQEFDIYENQAITYYYLMLSDIETTKYHFDVDTPTREQIEIYQNDNPEPFVDGVLTSLLELYDIEDECYRVIDEIGKLNEDSRLSGTGDNIRPISQWEADRDYFKYSAHAEGMLVNNGE